MIRLLATAGMIAVLATQPIAAQVKIGNNNVIVLDGRVVTDWAGIVSCPSNCVASITSTDGVTIGNGNTVTQTRRVDGGQTGTAVGGRPWHEVPSIMSGR